MEPVWRTTVADAAPPLPTARKRICTKKRREGYVVYLTMMYLHDSVVYFRTAQREGWIQGENAEAP